MKPKTDGPDLPRAMELRPSAAKRWTRCPAFPVLDQWNDDSPTLYSEKPWLLDGTYAHKLAEICLRTGDSPHDYIGDEVPCIVDEGTRFERTDIFVPDAEMVGNVNVYLQVCDDVRRYVKRTDGVGNHKIEDPVGTVFNRVSVVGTADFVALSPKRLVVVDFKYGENVEVDAVDNDQLSAYLLGAVKKYGYLDDPKHCILDELIGIIVQPRLTTGGPTIKKWEISNPLEWIERETKRFDAAVKRIVDQGTRGELEYVPSPAACQWCDSMNYCRGLWRYVEMIIDNIDIEVPELEPEFVRKILAAAKPIKDFVWSIEKNATTRALNGERFDGFKLVEGGRSPARVWKDEKKVLRLLDKKVEEGEVAEDKVFSDRSPITPAQMEKVLGKEFVEKHSSRPAYDRPTILVPEDDRRKAVATASEEFSDFMDEDDDVDLDDFDI